MQEAKNSIAVLAIATMLTACGWGGDAAEADVAWFQLLMARH
jgi:outer membrane lipopolysaccharide assembly protein LptE/RlpB